MYATDSAIDLFGSRFEDNRVGGGSAVGGGMYLDSSQAILVGCTLISNRGGHAGGGLSSNGGHLQVNASSVMGNAACVGGGLQFGPSSTSGPSGLLVDLAISHNVANCSGGAYEFTDGGGIYVDGARGMASIHVHVHVHVHVYVRAHTRPVLTQGLSAAKSISTAFTSRPMSPIAMAAESTSTVRLSSSWGMARAYSTTLHYDKEWACTIWPTPRSRGQ